MSTQAVPAHVIPLTTGLHPRAAKLLFAVGWLTRRYDRPPTIRELQAECAISSPSLVKYHLDTLTDRGLLVHEDRRPYGYRLKENTMQTEIVPAAALPFPALTRLSDEPQPVFRAAPSRTRTCCVAGCGLRAISLGHTFDDVEAQAIAFYEGTCLQHALLIRELNLLGSRQPIPWLDGDA